MVRNMIGLMNPRGVISFAVEAASWSASLPAQVSALWEDCPVNSTMMAASPHLLVSANKADPSVFS